MSKGLEELASLQLINRASFPSCFAQANDKSCEENVRGQEQEEGRQSCA